MFHSFKQYCLTCQTQVFDVPNNIVSSAEVNYSKKKTLDLYFWNTILELFTSSLLPEASDWEVWKGMVCFLILFPYDVPWVCFCAVWMSYEWIGCQCVFRESPEKGFRIHQSVFWCEECIFRGVHLTFWHFDKGRVEEWMYLHVCFEVINWKDVFSSVLIEKWRFLSLFGVFMFLFSAFVVYVKENI